MIKGDGQSNSSKPKHIAYLCDTGSCTIHKASVQSSETTNREAQWLSLIHMD